MYGNSIRLFKNKYRYDGIVHNKLKLDDFYDASEHIQVINFQFMERYKIEWKCEQNKRLMDKKIAAQGWTFMNAMHYADIFRKRWTWVRDINDAYQTIKYLGKALSLADGETDFVLVEKCRQTMQLLYKEIGNESNKVIQERISSTG